VGPIPWFAPHHCGQLNLKAGKQNFGRNLLDGSPIRFERRGLSYLARIGLPKGIKIRPRVYIYVSRYIFRFRCGCGCIAGTMRACIAFAWYFFLFPSGLSGNAPLCRLLFHPVVLFAKPLLPPPISVRFAELPQHRNNLGLDLFRGAAEPPGQPVNIVGDALVWGAPEGH
jgi:hypothetical protein